MNARIFGYVILGVTLLTLSGCGGSSQMQEVTFDTLRLQIPTDYQSVPASVVENKQILHKLLKSFKLPTEEGIFSPNIVITATHVAPTLDYEQFWTANISKIKQDLQGYEPGRKEIRTFACGDEDIPGISMTFQITDTFSTQQQTYYMAQYQFIVGGTGYIISTASGNPDDQHDLDGWIDSLTCL